MADDEGRVAQEQAEALAAQEAANANVEAEPPQQEGAQEEAAAADVPAEDAKGPEEGEKAPPKEAAAPESPASKEDTVKLTEEFNELLRGLAPQNFIDLPTKGDPRAQQAMDLYSRAKDHHHYLYNLKKSDNDAEQKKREAEMKNLLDAIKLLENKAANQIQKKYDPATHTPSKGVELDIDKKDTMALNMDAQAPYEKRGYALEEMFAAAMKFFELLNSTGYLERAKYLMTAVSSTVLGVGFRTAGRIGMALSTPPNTGGIGRWEAMYKYGMELDSTWPSSNPNLAKYALPNNTIGAKLYTVVRRSGFGNSQIPPGMYKHLMVLYDGEENYAKAASTNWAVFNRFKGDSAKPENTPEAKSAKVAPNNGADDGVTLKQKPELKPGLENAVDASAKNRNAETLEDHRSHILDQDQAQVNANTATRGGPKPVQQEQEVVQPPPINAVKETPQPEGGVIARIERAGSELRDRVDSDALPRRQNAAVPHSGSQLGLFGRMQERALEAKNYLTGVKKATATVSEVPESPTSTATTNKPKIGKA